MCSHTGPTRDLNEDLAGYRVPDIDSDEAARGALFVVADGMGGHQAGEVASRTAVETVIREYYADTEPHPGERLVRAVKVANRAIHDRAAIDPSRAGMGTTLVAAAVVGSRVYVVNVGDSRAYVLTQAGATGTASLSQITVDHSWVTEQVEVGRLRREQIAGHPQRNLITRALGTQPSVIVDLFKGDLVADDTLLLCSDGVCSVVPETRLAQILRTAPPQSAAEELVAQAALRGGSDNATALVVRATSASPAHAVPTGEKKREGAPGPTVQGDAAHGVRSVPLPSALGSALAQVQRDARAIVMAALPRLEEWGARVGAPPLRGGGARSRLFWTACAAALLVLVCLGAWAVATLVTGQKETADAKPVVAPIDGPELGKLSEADLAEYLGYDSIAEMQARHASSTGRGRWPAQTFVLVVGRVDDWQCEESGGCRFALEVADTVYTIDCQHPATDRGLAGEQVRVLAAVVDPASRTLTASLVERDDGKKKREHDWNQIVGDLPENERIWVYGILDELVEPADQGRQSRPAERRVLVLATWPRDRSSPLGVIDTYFYQAEGTYRLAGDTDLPILPQPTATLRVREDQLP
ncbi:MAG: protein phosphatase 2C domain-containing protein [Anaerolineae bacterium]|nr:protein phosphatase 2C domain-containing protein [Anaerolineae bacterium]